MSKHHKKPRVQKEEDRGTCPLRGEDASENQKNENRYLDTS